jgi:hypothetical protein
MVPKKILTENLLDLFQGRTLLGPLKKLHIQALHLVPAPWTMLIVVVISIVIFIIVVVDVVPAIASAQALMILDGDRFKPVFEIHDAIIYRQAAVFFKKFFCY